MTFPIRVLLLAFSVALPCVPAAAAAARTPVVVDTDIGNDIDDAFALAMVLRCPELELMGVTTVSGDTTARARIAAKLLWEAKAREVPVAAGVPGKRETTPQESWADTFSSPMLSSEDAVGLLHAAVQREAGRIVLIAMGPLTNIATLLKQHPEDAAKIREIALMGGSFARGYYPNSPATAESNIASDVMSAQTVFRSGVALRVAPLDVTAGLQMETAARTEVFAQHTPLTESLQALYRLWGQPTPTLHDAMAVAMVADPSLCRTKQLHVAVSADGMTRSVAGLPANATVAMQTDGAAFMRYYVSLFQQSSAQAGDSAHRVSSEKIDIQ